MIGKSVVLEAYTKCCRPVVNFISVIMIMKSRNMIRVGVGHIARIWEIRNT
jgi:hypothetical protein